MTLREFWDSYVGTIGAGVDYFLDTPIDAFTIPEVAFVLVTLLVLLGVPLAIVGIIVALGG